MRNAVLHYGVIFCVAVAMAGSAMASDPVPLLTIDAPVEGATLYVAPGTSLALLMASASIYSDLKSLSVASSMYSEVESVEFLVDGEVVGTATHAPYAAAVELDLTAMTLGDYTLSAHALFSGGGELTMEGVFTLAAAPEGSDDDSNGLPDNPFAILENGDYWFAGGDRNVAVLRVDADQWDADETVPLAVPDPSHTDQYLMVGLPVAALEAGESAALIVHAAPDITSLLGAANGVVEGALPGTYALSSDGFYGAAAVAVTTDGTAVAGLADDRLSANPLIWVFNGIDTSYEISMLAYPVRVVINETTGVLLDAVAEGSWGVPNGIDATHEGVVFAPIAGSVMAAPFIHACGEGEGEGEPGEGEGENPRGCFGGTLGGGPFDGGSWGQAVVMGLVLFLLARRNCGMRSAKCRV